MKIAAVLGVKDEVEIIGASIAHLRAIGVDLIAVSDFGSTDGTLDVLSVECRCGDVAVTRVDPDAVYDYSTGSASDVAQAERTGADWILFLDADEFFIPATGRLRDCQNLASGDVLSLDRFNVVATTSHPLMPADISPGHYDNLRLFTRQVDDFRGLMEACPEVPFISVRPGPKVMARRWAARAVAPGAHDVSSDGLQVRRSHAPDLLVAHVPFTTLRRFERKVANIRQEIVQHPRFFEGGYAWHWRRWAEMTAPGAIEREFLQQLTDPGALCRLEARGEVRTGAELFRERLAGTTDAASQSWWRDGLGTHRPTSLRPVEPAWFHLPARA